MPLSWNEIRDRATAFARDWKQAESEDADAKSFWDAFFDVFGVSRRRVASFERHVKKLDGRDGFIDLLWKGTLLVEHKSRGRDLGLAHKQALGYFEGLRERDLPRYVLVSDFARFRLFDLDRDSAVEFRLAELPRRIKHFAFIAGYVPQTIREQDPVNVRAAEKMGAVHDGLKAAGYSGHPLEVLLVRLLFCLFADDTGIFELQSFREFVEQRTCEDGADLGPRLAELFQVLNTEAARRQKNLDPQLAAFPYVNGQLFAETLPIAQFDGPLRQALLDCCALNWGAISPAIFGAMFQSVMDARARRNLGAHYTSEANILKLIKPLFLDELWAEFERVKNNRARLFDFHKKLRRLTFLDPACGCGNFLVITYRELRRLELEVLRASVGLKDSHSARLFEANLHQQVSLDVDQFYGIEIEEFPAQIAQVALWLTDHQMNQKVAEEFGLYFARIPLVTSPHIRHANALTTDWNEVLPAQRCSFVLGNPPFVGKQFQSPDQKADLASVTRGIAGAGVLDFVAAWFVKAAAYIRGTGVRCALVATNSITQGEQVGVLWGWLLAQGVHIHFAHRTFQWSNEARGVAAVHCVIVGFGLEQHAPKTIFEYDDLAGEPHAVTAANINPYLVDAPDVALPNRRTPVCAVPPIAFGSMPNDGGHLLLSAEERDALLAAEPAAEKWLRPFRGSEEFLNAVERWCVWLTDCPPNELRRMPALAARVAAVKAHRLASSRATTRALADTPSLFGEIRQPSGDYLLIPGVSSERRSFVPIGFMDARTIASNLVYVMPEATLGHFGVLCSTMHNAWVRYTCGRLESRYRYSAGIVYNNFPWPESPTDKQRAAVEAAAQGVLDARAQFPQSSLADLYDPLTMPPALTRAHQALDAAVDAAYGRRNLRHDAERVAFLFERYQAITSLLPAAAPRKGGRRASDRQPRSDAPAAT
jgi:hypothetical protein